MPSSIDLQLRSEGELRRAARRLHRLDAAAAGARDALPWLVPILFVAGIGATRLQLLEGQSWSQQDSHVRDLWDPDDEAAHAALYGWVGREADAQACAAWSLELAARWQAPAQVLREHDDAARERLTRRLLGLAVADTAAPAVQHLLRAQYDRLHAQGWTALLQAYWPLAERLASPIDAQLAFSAHAYGWDWREAPESAAAGLAGRVAALLDQAAAHATRAADATARPWRWPARRGLVIVAENSAVELVRAAWPRLGAGAVLAVYRVDDVARSAARGSTAWYAALCNAGPSLPVAGPPLSHGWRTWQACLQARRAVRLALNGVLPGALGLLPAAPASHWLRPGTPPSVLADPASMLRAPSFWDERTQAPALADPMHIDTPPLNAAWQATLRSALQRAQQRPAEPAGMDAVSRDAAPAAEAALLGLRRHAPIGQPEHLSAWRFEPAPGRTQTASSPNRHLPCDSPAQLCSAVIDDLTQRLLREPPTPYGQPLSPLGERVLAGRGAKDAR